MIKRHAAFGAIAILFVVTITAFSFWVASLPKSEIISGDGAVYSTLAENILTTGGYTWEGKPFFEREPGMPVFLAGVYAVFGAQNVMAVFFIQAFLYLVAVLIFCRAIRPSIGDIAMCITAGVLLLSPLILKITFSLYRESLALSLFLFGISALITWIHTRKGPFAVIAGALLGCAILVYAPLLLLPIFLLPFFFILKLRWQHIVLFLCAVGIVCAPWVVRNIQLQGSPCFTGCYRNVLQWYVRAEQSEQLFGLEPLRCLYAEYISRDWSGRSPYCSFNAVWHSKWPEGFVGVPADAEVTKVSQQKIFANFPNYLWMSLFEIVEFHIPFVGAFGGTTLNLAISLGMLIVYIGCACWLWFLVRYRRRPAVLEVLLLLIMAYSIALFALTDATPRYLVPLFFCYAVLSGIGFDQLFHVICKRHHPGIQ